jgi:hypothetical protein
VSKASRDKGKRGEYEVRDAFRSIGYIDCGRNLEQPSSEGFRVRGDLTGGPAELHIEVKRCERIELPKWLRQAEGQAGEGVTPVVVYRRSHEPWRAVVPLDYLLGLLKEGRW